MYKKLMNYLTMIALLLGFNAKAQVVKTVPHYLTPTNIFYNIYALNTYGNKALQNYNGKVYIHLGLITSNSQSPTDWRYTKTTWGVNNDSFLCEHQPGVSGSTKFTITNLYYGNKYNVRNYFKVSDPNEKILKIAFLFRDTTGTIVQTNADNSDMYLPVYDDNAQYVEFVSPLKSADYQNSYINTTDFSNYSKFNVFPFNAKYGDTISANSLYRALSNTNSNFTVEYNGQVIASAQNAQSVGIPAIILNKIGKNKLKITATNVSNPSLIDADSIEFYLNLSQNAATLPLPAGVKEGVNYEPGDTSVILVQYAPNKGSMLAFGDFSSWNYDIKYLMNKTPDGIYYWKRITGLVPQREYIYQFLIDSNLVVADLWCEKVSDPWNDQWVPTETYPNLIPYPFGKTNGIASVFQTGKTKYVFQNTNFIKPDRHKLVVYELLIRDFLQKSNYQTLIDTLNYLKNLGINAIELLPVTEFEGNLSWGYNVAYHFAVDKYYGPEDQLKRFIDVCHSKGIAVILDAVLNHVFGSSPICNMYWDNVNNIPAANNPWVNQYPKHPANVGYDFNHEAPATKYYVTRFIKRWLNDFNIDGFRWDLSKGFTQNYTTTYDAWNIYDASRVAIWKNIYDTIQSVKNNTYCILEHLGGNQEEIDLSNYGMVMWSGGGANHSVAQSTMGWTTDWDFSYGISAQARGWTYLNLMGYAESHDEERLNYQNLNFGNSYNGYNTQDLNTALGRQGMAAALYLLVPGPKMIWQFGELGYDYSINYCDDTRNSTDCRTNAKPVRWDYFTNPNRKGLYDVFSKIIKLKLDPSFSNTFHQLDAGRVRYDFSGNIKWLNLYDQNLQIVVLGNFDVARQSGNVNFSSLGTWYSLLNNVTFNVNTYNLNVNLAPGEYYILSNRPLNNNRIWASFNSGGIIDTIGKTFNAYSTNQTLNISPLQNYKLDSVIVNNRVVAAFNAANAIQYPNSYRYTFNNIRSDSNIRAVFSANTSLLSTTSFFFAAAPKPTPAPVINANLNISLYPNPTRNNVFIAVKNNEEDLNYTVMTTFGRVMYKGTINKGDTKDIYIPAVIFPRGTYNVVISGKNTPKKSYSFIKL
ncbi:MAG: alpha-amylase family glycosyl hydrolase [Alphaproteobacteria bacterium]|nr:alpha-amylase family glycosyl hydrolase [Alphaproteobacteria bacterium]